MFLIATVRFRTSRMRLETASACHTVRRRHAGRHYFGNGWIDRGSMKRQLGAHDPTRLRDRAASVSPGDGSTELPLRKVCYHWHAWFGRSVTVDEVLIKSADAACRCDLDDASDQRSLEIPAWMCEPTACDRLCLTTEPIVSGEPCSN
jgi:hypothetical protein